MITSDSIHNDVSILFDLAAQWREHANVLAEYGFSELASVLRLHAEQLSAAVVRFVRIATGDFDDPSAEAFAHGYDQGIADGMAKAVAPNQVDESPTGDDSPI
jgi:hypothetical protein